MIYLKLFKGIKPIRLINFRIEKLIIYIIIIQLHKHLISI